MNKVYLRENKIEVECSGIIDFRGDNHCEIRSDEDYIISGEALSRIMLLLNKLPGIVVIESLNRKKFQVAKTEEIEKLLEQYKKGAEYYFDTYNQYCELKEKVQEHNKSCRFYERKIDL